VRGSWGRTLVVASACALALSACSGGDDAPEAEVGGVALERDEDGGTVAVEDERGATAEEEGLVDADEGDEADEGALDDPADDDPAEDGTTGTTDADATAGDGTSSTGATTADGSGSASGGAPAPAPSPASGPSPTASPTASPPPASSPAPAPAPRVLGAGPAFTGSDASGLGDDGWVVTSSTGPTEPGDLPPPFRVDVDVVSEGGPLGGAVCAVSLQAGEDRGLVAVGRATVTLVLTADDGTVRRLTRQLLDLDVELGPGGALQVDPSAPVEVDARQLASATCEARFDPAG
jgi:hypothetical protein